MVFHALIASWITCCHVLFLNVSVQELSFVETQTGKFQSKYSKEHKYWYFSFLQACSYTHEQIVEMMEFLIEYGPAQLYWEPAEVFLKLSCVQLMLQLISIACDWKTYYARWEHDEV